MLAVKVTTFQVTLLEVLGTLFQEAGILKPLHFLNLVKNGFRGRNCRWRLCAVVTSPTSSPTFQRRQNFGTGGKGICGCPRSSRSRSELLRSYFTAFRRIRVRVCVCACVRVCMCACVRVCLTESKSVWLQKGECKSVCAWWKESAWERRRVDNFQAWLHPKKVSPFQALLSLTHALFVTSSFYLSLARSPTNENVELTQPQTTTHTHAHKRLPYTRTPMFTYILSRKQPTSKAFQKVINKEDSLSTINLKIGANDLKWAFLP